MPRKLPWATPSTGSKTQVNLSSRPAKKQHVDSDLDDDFFSGTVLESSGKGKGRVDASDSEDKFSEKSRSRPRSKVSPTRAKPGGRVPSSSPPPASELPPPKIELMRKGVGKFDLRDDEWYMVEDEFLQTAELFTRHLHLREYERLKEIVQYKKDIVRPVVASAKPSEERQIQIQTEKKTKTQKAALEDVFGSSGKGNIDDYLGAPKRATIPKDNHTKQRKPEISDSDSEDLDNLPKPTVPKRSTSDAPFVKPAPPSKPRTPAPPPVPTPDKSPRKRRQSTFSFDDYSHDPPSSPPAAPPTSNTRLTSPQKPRVQFSQTAETSKVPASSRPARSINSLFDDDDLPRGNPISKEQTERLARRQVEREKKKKEEKKKSIGLDDIPTFLF